MLCKLVLLPLHICRTLYILTYSHTQITEVYHSKLLFWTFLFNVELFPGISDRLWFGES